MGIPFSYIFDAGRIQVFVYKDSIFDVGGPWTVDAIVNPANVDLTHVSGIAKLISVHAGQRLQDECREYIRNHQRLDVTRNIVTNSGKLRNCDFVIHAVGPKWNFYKNRVEEFARDLYLTVIHILETADKNGLRSVAMPTISSGTNNTPKDICAEMYIKAIIDYARNRPRSSVRQIYIVDTKTDVLKVIESVHRTSTSNPDSLWFYKAPFYQLWNTGSKGQGRASSSKGGRVPSSDQGCGGGQGGARPKSSVHSVGSGQFPDRKGTTWTVSLPSSSPSGIGLDVSVSTGYLTDVKHVDAIVCSVGALLDGGTLFQAIKDAAGPKYERALAHRKKQSQHFKPGDVIITEGGNLGKHVLHAVMKSRKMTAVKDVQEWLLKVTVQILKEASLWGFTTIAMPLLGIGGLTNEDDIERCASTLADAVMDVFKTGSVKTLSVKTILVVNKNSTHTRIMENVIKKKFATYGDSTSSSKVTNHTSHDVRQQRHQLRRTASVEERPREPRKPQDRLASSLLQPKQGWLKENGYPKQQSPSSEENWPFPRDLDTSKQDNDKETADAGGDYAHEMHKTHVSKTEGSNEIDEGKISEYNYNGHNCSAENNSQDRQAHTASNDEDKRKETNYSVHEGSASKCDHNGQACMDSNGDDDDGDDDDDFVVISEEDDSDKGDNTECGSKDEETPEPSGNLMIFDGSSSVVTPAGMAKTEQRENDDQYAHSLTAVDTNEEEDASKSSLSKDVMCSKSHSPSDTNNKSDQDVDSKPADPTNAELLKNTSSDEEEAVKSDNYSTEPSTDRNKVKQTTADPFNSADADCEMNKKQLETYERDMNENSDDEPPACESKTNSVTEKSGKPDEDKKDSSSDSTCVICMDIPNKPKKLPCGHEFCKECVKAAFKHKPACPICGKIFGEVTGNQPKGKMDIQVYKRYEMSLPGYEGHGTIMIDYQFKSGTQGSNHPHPGQFYKGTRRKAYLPNNSEGRKVLDLLNIAWERRLVFTIGDSRTTGQGDVVTWNDIHHKTNIYGGPQKFGYPDPEYLSRVKEELEAKGITENLLE